MGKEKRQIPLKNYFILIFLFIGVVLLLWYFSKWYEAYDDYEKQTPVIRGTLAEISDLELDHYLLENPDSVIYLCTSEDEHCRSFEKNFKKMLNANEHFKTGMVYLNLSDVDQDKFVKKFNDSYPYRVSLTKNYPALILFEDGEIIGLLQEKDNYKLDIEEVRGYLKLHQVGENER